MIYGKHSYSKQISVVLTVNLNQSFNPILIYKILKRGQNLKPMNFFKHTPIYALLIVASLFIYSCSKDDDANGNNNSDTTITVNDGRIAFDVSDFENTAMEGEVVYHLNNQYNIKYLKISLDEAIVLDDNIWRISIEQNSNETLALPEPGEYPIVQGLTNTYNQDAFNATISMHTDEMTDSGTHFGGNNSEINGTLTIVSNTDDVIKGTFSFEAYNPEGEKITVTNGQFVAPENSFW